MSLAPHYRLLMSGFPPLQFFFLSLPHLFGAMVFYFLKLIRIRNDMNYVTTSSQVNDGAELKSNE